MASTRPPTTGISCWSPDDIVADAVVSSRPLSLPDAATAVVQALGEDPVAVRARYELMLESGRSAGLREHAARWRAAFVAAVRPLLERDDVEDADAVAALLAHRRSPTDAPNAAHP